MSIWGKLSGAAAGFLLGGGPLGALAGAVAGHLFFDREDDHGSGEPDVMFTIAVIALSAKMAKADGVVTDDEIEAFERLFRVPDGEAANVRRVFDLARQDTAGYESYAAQIARAFRGRPGMLEDVLDGLFEIAKADGVFHPSEDAFLARVAEIFGFAPAEYRRMKATHFGVDRSDPYAVLGVAPDASDEEIRRTWLLLVQENHPDRLVARGVPEEFVKIANAKLATINAAHDRIRKERAAEKAPA
jgi:DnaJ like chaperone protein